MRQDRLPDQIESVPQLVMDRRSTIGFVHRTIEPLAFRLGQTTGLWGRQRARVKYRRTVACLHWNPMSQHATLFAIYRISCPHTENASHPEERMESCRPFRF